MITPNEGSWNRLSIPKQITWLGIYCTPLIVAEEALHKLQNNRHE